MAIKHFKREAVHIALTSGLTRRQVASDLGVGFSTLAKWIQKSKPDDLPPASDVDLAKDNGGMGTFYRSRHELVFAFKNGTAPHLNTFELGQNGRYRTNVWEYRGVNTLTTSGMDEQAMHPTVKPVQMIADAIKDISGRGDIVMDLFGGFRLYLNRHA